MSCTAEESLAIKDCVFAAKSYRVSRRKRHRNKSRGSKLRKKGFKKFYRTSKTDSYKSNIYIFNSVSEKMMSNWYWSNYKKAVEWQDRHKLVHWKACALALLEENRYLLQIINNLQPGMVPKVSVTNQNLGKKTNCNEKVMKMKKPKTFTKSSTFANYNSVNVGVRDDDDDDDYDDDDDDDDDDAAADEEEMSEEIEFEMSEEMIQFFEQSYKHKMNLKKIKEEEMLNKAEQEVEQIQNNKIKRSVEMSFLYGDGASMIIGMETAVQLSFDKYCDTKSPKYWPNIPFRL